MAGTEGHGELLEPREEHPNAQLSRALWQAISHGDAPAVRALLASDVVWRSYEAGDLSGERHGPDGVLDLLAIAGEWVDEMRLELLDVYASDQGAVLRYRMRARREAMRVDHEVILLLEIGGAQVRSAFSVPTDPAANRSFWRAPAQPNTRAH